MTLSVVICTCDRPGDLAVCLRSLAAQDRRPEEVIVVDASAGEASASRVAEWAAATPEVAVQCIRADRGLTRQRNLGAAAARGDIVTFLDDDVELDAGYLAAVLEIFEADPDVGGVEGVVWTPPLRGRRRLANAFRALFLMSSLGRRRRVKRSGCATYAPWPRAPQEVDCLAGCNMSYRREVLRRFRFDEWFDGYGLWEDQDFSFRVSRRHRLIQTPRARLRHYLSPVARDRLPALYEMRGVNHFYFVRKNLPPTPLTWLCFAWSELGELLSVLKTVDGEAIAGKLRGYRRLVRTTAPAVPAVPAGGSS